ncbi:LacI family DNA-binding transcriptional regulator [Streptomyces rubrogriseus]|uniref:LacI family DNA-binding transcriptional regulator n=1 Tax=Streptomyces rubrogriseus TaxID=194673 RepID=UPI0036F9BB2D
MSVPGHTPPAVPATPGKERDKSVSIRDVAKAAGVSHQTVSRVINDHPNVKTETRQRVEDAIRTLGFRRNAAAFALASGVTKAVTVLTSSTILYGYAATLQGLEEAARTAGYIPGIRVLTPEDDLDRTVQKVAESSHGILVIAFDRLGMAALERIPSNVPCAAAVEAPPPGQTPDRPGVWIDDRAAAQTATEHLLGLGHPTVHYVAIPASTGSRRSATPRAEGWLRALRAVGVTPPAPVGDGWDASAGYTAGRELARDPGVTAIMCGNDDLALGVLRALHEAGRSVPDDVSLVGFDDSPLSRFVTPALTTVRMDFPGLGRATFALLRSQLDPQYQPPDPAVVGTDLIVRESTGSHHV